jgi:hypothetical protein
LIFSIILQQKKEPWMSSSKSSLENLVCNPFTFLHLLDIEFNIQVQVYFHSSIHFWWEYQSYCIAVSDSQNSKIGTFCAMFLLW